MLARIGLHHSLLSATDAIQRDRNGLNDKAYSELPTVTEEGLLTIPKKTDNIAYKSNDNHNMELDELS